MNIALGLLKGFCKVRRVPALIVVRKWMWVRGKKAKVPATRAERREPDENHRRGKNRKKRNVVCGRQRSDNFLSPASFTQ